MAVFGKKVKTPPPKKKPVPGLRSPLAPPSFAAVRKRKPKVRVVRRIAKRR